MFLNRNHFYLFGHNLKSICSTDIVKTLTQNNSPNEVCDDEELDATVYDANSPALYHHGLGRLIGKEICYAVPHCSRTLLHSQKLHSACINVFV